MSWKWCFGPFFFFFLFCPIQGLIECSDRGSFFSQVVGQVSRDQRLLGWRSTCMLEYLWVKKLSMHCPRCVAKRSRGKKWLLLLMNIVIVIIWLLSHDRDRTDAINSANNLHVWRVRPMAYWVFLRKAASVCPFYPNGSTGIRCSQSHSRHTYSYIKI